LIYIITILCSINWEVTYLSKIFGIKRKTRRREIEKKRKRNKRKRQKTTMEKSRKTLPYCKEQDWEISI
jgi:hypothetical protein